MVSVRDTLIIKHLPPDITDRDKEELLRHYGAKDVKCITSKINKYSVVFARFQNEQTAAYVLHRLHQLNINGYCLSVEFTKGKDTVLFSKEKELKDFENEEEIENEKCYKRFLEKLNSWHSAVNFKQPVPNHLRYQYPPPDNVVLLNIAKVLATAPKFYTQVLHLMNKMNLPCPFGKDVLPDFDMQLTSTLNKNQGIAEVPETVPEESTMEPSTGTSESEISSDDEVKKERETIPDQVKIRKKKVMNMPKFVKPMTVSQGSSKQKKTSIDEVFEKHPEEKESKRIKLGHPPSKETQRTNLDTDTESTSGFGYLHPVAKPMSPPPPVDLRDEREEERLEKPEVKCIGFKELTENRISEKDRSVLPVYRNYAEGAPTCRLYIKNLSKTVTEEDLKYIYNRYLPTDSLEPQVLDLRLMQEGRMKGQAFVTFHSVQLAQTALKETNGFILKNKPLVVQFARSSAK